MAKLVLKKSGKNFKLYTDEAGEEQFIKLENVRFSYPNFGHKREQESDTGKTRESWGGVAMLGKDTHKEAKAELDKIMESILTKNKARVESGNRFLKDGDDKEDENMHGHWLATFSEGKRQPTIRDENGEIMGDKTEIDDKFYGGCWGHVLIRPWFFNGKAKGDSKTYPKRISCGFTGAQFTKDDTPFGNGRVDDGDAWDTAGSSDDGDDGL